MIRRRSCELLLGAIEMWNGEDGMMSANTKHDPESFMLALASAYRGARVASLTWAERDQWHRVARCAGEHLARDAAAAAAASEVAQGAAMKVLERVLDIMTPDQMPKLAAIMADLRAVPS